MGNHPETIGSLRLTTPNPLPTHYTISTSSDTKGSLSLGSQGNVSLGFRKSTPSQKAHETALVHQKSPQRLEKETPIQTSSAQLLTPISHEKITKRLAFTHNCLHSCTATRIHT